MEQLQRLSDQLEEELSLSAASWWEASTVNWGAVMAALTYAWSPESVLDSSGPPADPGPSAWPAAA